MFWELAGVPAVAARRGTRVESVHNVAACVADDQGTVVLKVGTVETPVFLRSAAKPFIAAASVRAGVIERFGFGDRELAIMAASHSGEPAHVELVSSMLERIGATVEDLQCGPQVPSDAIAAAALAARHEAPSARLITAKPTGDGSVRGTPASRGRGRRRSCRPQADRSSLGTDRPCTIGPTPERHPRHSTPGLTILPYASKLRSLVLVSALHTVAFEAERPPDGT